MAMTEPPGSALEKRNCRKGEIRGRTLARVANFIKNAPRRGAFLFGVKCRNYGTDECYQEK